jgi:hypothetical protein
MQVTFALAAIEAARRSPEDVTVIQLEPGTKSDLLQRFTKLRGSWAAWYESHLKDSPELESLIKEAGKAMEQASLAVSDIQIAHDNGTPLTMERVRIIKILRMSRKALREGQKVSHVEGFKMWIVPRRPLADDQKDKFEEWSEEHRGRRMQNKKAALLSEGRKHPIRCCMYIALAFSQLLLDENDMLAEYEAAVMDETFDRALEVDDGKVYEWSQIKNHTFARLHPPTNRWPRLRVPYKEEEGYVPLRIRNPLRHGVPIVTNQLHPQAATMTNYVNPNRTNIPQDFFLATQGQAGSSIGAVS